MLNQTTVTALQTLLYLCQRSETTPVAPAEIARQLEASLPYLSKIHTQLVRADLLRAHRGAKGGVTLARAPKDITLLEIVEACQGKVLGDYCQPYDDLAVVCGFHAAMHDLQGAILGSLSRWTLEDLRQRPRPTGPLQGHASCRMACAVPKQGGAERMAENLGAPL
jgi:Rrf2 family protein